MADRGPAVYFVVMPDDPKPVLPYSSSVDPPAAPRRRKLVSPWTIAVLVVLCIVAGVVWLKLDREQRVRAAIQQETDRQVIAVRKQESELKAKSDKVLEQLKKEREDAKAHAAQIEHDGQ